MIATEKTLLLVLQHSGHNRDRKDADPDQIGAVRATCFQPAPNAAMMAALPGLRARD
jgi:hypothetical protein